MTNRSHEVAKLSPGQRITYSGFSGASAVSTSTAPMKARGCTSSIAERRSLRLRLRSHPRAIDRRLTSSSDIGRDDVTEEMTPKQFRSKAIALAKKVGPRAEVFVSLTTGYREDALSATVYSDGIGGHIGAIFSVTADDFDELSHQLTMKWFDYEDTHRARMVREIALAIIRITADQGSCSDAALRVDFDLDDIAKYGEAACADANEIADRGPFAIIKTATANAA